MKSSIRIDLHVHSRHSKRPAQWILRKLGCSESYSNPDHIYNLARLRGMDYVTITDHNSLAGSLEIAHHERTFLGEEVTTYFPEDNCKLHVLVYRITERNHEDISHLRKNVYELVSYLRRENIVHVLAHPLFSINERLTRDHVEKTLLLFENFELNGTRSHFQNNVVHEILKHLTKSDIERLSNKHNIEPAHENFWKKNIVAGSDDHSSITIAHTYTEVPEADNLDDFFSAIQKNRALTRNRPAHPKILGHNIYSIAYQFYKDKLNLERFTSKELLLRFADRVLIPTQPNGEGLFERVRNYIYLHRTQYFTKSDSKNLIKIVQHEARELIKKDPFCQEVLHKIHPETEELTEIWFRFLNSLSDRIFKQFADNLFNSISGANLFDVFHSIGSVGSLYALLSPYFVTYSLFTRDKKLTEQCFRIPRFLKDAKDNAQEINVAHFTDTIEDINGVAKTLRKQIEIASITGKSLEVITCGASSSPENIKNFEAIGSFDLPEYDGLKLFYPPLLTILNYCYERQFTHVHVATPGPLGLAGMAISRILNLPLYGTYHTALPQYASLLTGELIIEEMMWKYMSWFYNQMDVVYVPSQAIGEELAAHGIEQTKITFYPRGIDIDTFHPSRANGFYQKKYNLPQQVKKVLYSGRVSKEKNLETLEIVVKGLADQRSDFQFIIVGDGPYLGEMKARLGNYPVTFTGFLSGDELAEAYASSDIFIFPSLTDTFGLVVLEAQASGLPVLVTDKGGPHENVLHNETGYIIPEGNPHIFLEKLNYLLDNPTVLAKMKKSARSFMQNRSFESAFEKLWESYKVHSTSDGQKKSELKMTDYISTFSSKIGVQQD